LILIWKYFTLFTEKSQYLFKGEIKMLVEEQTAKEKLIEFILNLTEEEVETILSAIKKDNELMSLKYDYHITKTASQVDNTPVESIYVSGSWRITVVNGKIHVKQAGWSTYEVPNLASLYKVLAADNGSDNDETIRQQYSIVVKWS
jgi:hypothetical protein